MDRFSDVSLADAIRLAFSAGSGRWGGVSKRNHSNRIAASPVVLQTVGRWFGKGLLSYATGLASAVCPSCRWRLSFGGFRFFLVLPGRLYCRAVAPLFLALGLLAASGIQNARGRQCNGEGMPASRGTGEDWPVRCGRCAGRMRFVIDRRTDHEPSHSPSSCVLVTTDTTHKVITMRQVAEGSSGQLPGHASACTPASMSQ